MSLESMAVKMNKATGETGPELEWRVFFVAMIYADALKDKKAGDYFQGRMRASFAKSFDAQH